MTTIRRRLAGLLAGITLAALATSVAGQQPAPRQDQPVPTFRSSIEAVQVDVYVTDAEGNPVTGLTADDFELVEDGKPQPITTFEEVNIPIERTELVERQLAEPDVASNDAPLGRVYLFALDEVWGANILRTRRFVRQFIEEHFGPNDLGAIALLGRGLATDGQDFTGNRRLLLNATDKFTGGFAAFESSARSGTASCAGGGRQPGSVRSRPGGGIDRSQQVASLRSMTEMLARVPGRHKAMLIFTECLELDVQDLVDYNGGVLSLRGDDAHAAMMAATRSNIAIYPIDPTGLSPEVTIPLEAIGAMRSLGDATGGFALVNSNRFTETFERIVRDNSNYYMLAFNSAYDRDDGRYVRVAVRVKRPDLTVRTRDGYVAPTRDERRAQARAREKAPSAPVSVALATPIATSGIPIRVVATPFKGRGRNAAVALAVEVDASALGLRPEKGFLKGDFVLRYLATDAKRNVYPEVAHTAAVEVKSDATADRLPLDRIRVRVVTELDLPEGRYQLRVAAGTAVVAGNVIYDLEVPDFGDGPLAMSGVALVTGAEPLVLTLASARGATTNKAVKCYSDLCAAPSTRDGARPLIIDGGKPWLEGRLPGPPTTQREFAANEAVTLVAEVYDNQRRAAKDPARITLTTDLRGEDGSVFPLTEDERGTAAARSASGGHAFTVRLPLDRVAPGAYVLRVRARSSATADQHVTREIPIRIR